MPVNVSCLPSFETRFRVHGLDAFHRLSCFVAGCNKELTLRMKVRAMRRTDIVNYVKQAMISAVPESSTEQ